MCCTLVTQKQNKSARAESSGEEHVGSTMRTDIFLACVVETPFRDSASHLFSMRFLPFKTIFSYVVSLLIAGMFCVLLLPSTAHAATYSRANELTVGSNTSGRLKLFDGKFHGGATVASGDVNGDGVDEFIVGAGKSGGPQVIVYNADGTKRSSFFALDKKMLGGIYVAAADLDGDSKAEILVSPQSGYKPEVAVYSAIGTKLFSFTPFESSFTGGVRIAATPMIDGWPSMIIVAAGSGRQQDVKVYKSNGTSLHWTFQPYGMNVGNGLMVAAGISDTFRQPVVAVGSPLGKSSQVKIYGLDTKTLLASWRPFGEGMKSGSWLAMNRDVVFATPDTGGGPEVRRFDVRGNLLASFFAFEKTFRGGAFVAAPIVDGTVTSITTARALDNLDLVARSGKKIVISLSKQELRMYEHGQVISTRRVSTGKWSTPTPVGEFRTRNKIVTAYSKPYNLYMEYWMAFSADGSYGLHSLPYWKTKSGGKYYEGAAHIGTPVSHGCIRQTLAEAKSLFDWAPVGTPVVIVK